MLNAFTKNIIYRIEESSSIVQLYEVFKKYKDYLDDESLYLSFKSRTEYLKSSSQDSCITTQCERLMEDIEDCLNIVYADGYKKPTTKKAIKKYKEKNVEILLSFKTSKGLVMQDALAAITKMSIEKFKGQKKEILVHLGMESDYFDSIVNTNPEVKELYAKIKKQYRFE